MYNKVQNSTAQLEKLQYCTVRYSIVQYTTAVWKNVWKLTTKIKISSFVHSGVHWYVLVSNVWFKKC